MNVSLHDFIEMRDQKCNKQTTERSPATGTSNELDNINIDSLSDDIISLWQEQYMNSFTEFLGFHASTDGIALQGIDHEQGIFKCVKDNNEEEVFDLIRQDKYCVYYRDAVGGTPVHVAFLYRNFELGKKILKKRRDVGTLTYTLTKGKIIRYPNTFNRSISLKESPYEGQNLLHMAIMHREPELAGWLIEEFPELINGELIGELFEPNRHNYFGSTPLLCALSTNQVEVAKKILTYSYSRHHHLTELQNDEHAHLSKKQIVNFKSQSTGEKRANHFETVIKIPESGKGFETSSNRNESITKDNITKPRQRSATAIHRNPDNSRNIFPRKSISLMDHKSDKLSEFEAIRAFGDLTASILTEDLPDDSKVDNLNNTDRHSDIAREYGCNIKTEEVTHSHGKCRTQLIMQADKHQSPDFEEKFCVLHNQIDSRDHYGNNVLHLAVLHNLPNIYDFAVNYTMELLMKDKGRCYIEKKQKKMSFQNRDDNIYRDVDENEVTPIDTNVVEFLKRENDDVYAAMMKFLYARNKDDLSPLTLSAAVGCSDMFKHIIRKSSIDAWDYGPTRAYYIPLLDLEQPVPLPESRVKQHGNLFHLLRKLPFPFAPKSDQYYRSAIECLCTYETLSSSLSKSFIDMDEVYDRRMKILCSDEVRPIVEKKWNLVYSKQFFNLYALYCVYLVTLNVSLLFGGFGAQPNSFGDLVSWSSITWLLSWLSDILCVSLATTKLIQELTSLVFYFWAYISEAGAGRWDNIVSITATTSTLIAFILRVSDANEASRRVFTAIALIFGCLYNFFFFLGFQTTGPFIIMIMRMISTDLSRFFLVFIVILAGFSQAHFVLLEDSENIEKLTVSISKLLISGIVGEVNYENTYGDKSIIVQVMMWSFLILVFILLLNVLIAMMGHTYERIMDEANERWTAERSNIMQSLGTQRADEELLNDRFLYGFPVRSRGTKYDMYTKFEVQEDAIWREKVTGKKPHKCESCYSNYSWKKIKSDKKKLGRKNIS